MIKTPMNKKPPKVTTELLQMLNPPPNKILEMEGVDGLENETEEREIEGLDSETEEVDSEN